MEQQKLNNKGQQHSSWDPLQQHYQHIRHNHTSRKIFYDIGPCTQNFKRVPNII